MAISSFACKETKKIFNLYRSKKLPQEIQHVALRKLRVLHAVKTLEELKQPPGNNLEKLKGDLRNCYSIRINNQWRIIFEFKDNDALNVRIRDYH
jgi:Plasmid maintenance system killer protein